MKKRLVLILCLLALYINPVMAAKQVSLVEFMGLKRTKPKYLRQLIATRADAPFSAETLAQDVQILRNLGLFSNVNTKIENTENGVKIWFVLKEWLTRIPIFRFGGIQKNFWFDLGLKDFNWLGRGYHFGGFYRYYDRHSGAVFLRMPQIEGSPWGIKLNVSLFSTIEPAYFVNQTTYYNVDRWEFILGLIYHFSKSLYLELSGGYLAETYDKNVEKSEEGTPGPDFRKFNKWLTRLQLVVDDLNYKDITIKGIAHDLTLERIVTEGESQHFWKILGIFRAYFLLGKRGNFAFRSRTGFATNEESPFVPFVLDSYLTVRGVGNRVARGTSELTFNFEYRHLAWQQEWGAIQAVAFLDWSAWRPAGGSLKEMFQSPNVVTFGGFGFRLYLRKIQNLCFRMDLGISLTDKNQRGVVLGLGHYF
jgi:outer membrane protein insertion porin family